MKRSSYLKINAIIALFSILLLLTTPAAAMTDMNGKPVQLQSMVGKGKWTVVKVWESDCHICRRTIHYLSQFKSRFPEAEIFGISVDGQDGRQDARQFISQFKLNFPNLLSDGTEMSDYLYAAVGETMIGTPTIIVYDPQGRIAAIQPGAVTPQELIGFIRSKQAERAASN
ncbi:MAG: TlpA disulfide reductase family protein [Thiolinea sp.]